MKNAFTQVASFIEQEVPGALVVGETYPPTAVNAALSEICRTLFFVGLFLMVGGEYLGNSMRIPQLTSAAKWMKEHQMYTIAAVFILNQLSTSLLSTGAFEIYQNDNLVWSKLESGALPNQAQLQEMFSSLPLPRNPTS